MADEVRGGGVSGGARVLLGILALLLAAVGSSHELLTVTGPGMVPTLWPGDTVLVRRGWLVRAMGEPASRGSVVVFEEDGTRYLRRVVALEGETIAIGTGGPRIDGDPVEVGTVREVVVPMGRCGQRTATAKEERHGSKGAWVLSAGDHPELTVPEGSVFLLGDYRREASDSRHWGPASLSALGGAAEVVLWSRDPCDGGLRAARALSTLGL